MSPHLFQLLETATFCLSSVFFASWAGLSTLLVSLVRNILVVKKPLPEWHVYLYGQNAFFYDSAEGLLTAVVLLLAEYLPPTEEAPQERWHIVSVFKLVQDLLAPSKTKGKNGFQVLMDSLPDTHKARWFAGAALNSAE